MGYGVGVVKKMKMLPTLVKNINGNANWSGN